MLVLLCPSIIPRVSLPHADRSKRDIDMSKVYPDQLPKDDDKSIMKLFLWTAAK